MRTLLLQTVLLQVMVAYGSAVAPAQQPAGPAFETATIRSSHFTPGCFSMLQPGSTHYAVTCLSLKNLIAMGWGINGNDIQGGDAHALDAYYDLSATTPGEKPWTFDTIRPMVRQLLIERFHVAAHSGTKVVSGFGLVVAKEGSRLKPASFDSMQEGWKAGEGARNYIMAGHIQGRGANMGTVAGLLSSPARAPVIDRTGLKGTFNLDLNFAPENTPDSNLPSFFTAVEEQLGLKLQPEKVTVDTLIIDHVDSAPTPD